MFQDFEAHVVRSPRVTMTSLTAIGTARERPGSSPLAIFASTARAEARARSGENVRYALVLGFSASANASASRASSSALNSFEVSAFRIDANRVRCEPLRSAHRSITLGT